MKMSHTSSFRIGPWNHISIECRSRQGSLMMRPVPKSLRLVPGLPGVTVEKMNIKWSCHLKNLASPAGSVFKLCTCKTGGCLAWNARFKSRMKCSLSTYQLAEKWARTARKQANKLLRRRERWNHMKSLATANDSSSSSSCSCKRFPFVSLVFPFFLPLFSEGVCS